MSALQIFILSAQVVLLLSVVVSLYFGYKLSKRMQHDNTHLRGIVDEMEQRTDQQQKQLEELQGQLQTSDEVLQLKSQTLEMSEDIRNTDQMTDEELMSWIDRRVDETKMYLNADLKLKGMAHRLGLTQKRLQTVLKEQSRYANLSEYLTEKRFLEACRLLREQPNWTIEAVCEESGFGSRRTFHNVFKDKLGLSPSQYRHSQEGVKHGQ